MLRLLPYTLCSAALVALQASALIPGLIQGFENGAIPGIPALPSASSDNTVDYIVIGGE